MFTTSLSCAVNFKSKLYKNSSSGGQRVSRSRDVSTNIFQPTAVNTGKLEMGSYQPRWRDKKADHLNHYEVFVLLFK